MTNFTLADVQFWHRDIENSKYQTLTAACQLLKEEYAELTDELAVLQVTPSEDALAASVKEFGDVLVTLCMVAEKLGVDIQTALNVAMFQNQGKMYPDEKEAQQAAYRWANIGVNAVVQCTDSGKWVVRAAFDCMLPDGKMIPRHKLLKRI